jgi:hypothetical protein
MVVIMRRWKTTTDWARSLHIPVYCSTVSIADYSYYIAVHYDNQSHLYPPMVHTYNMHHYEQNIFEIDGVAESGCRTVVS